MAAAATAAPVGGKLPTTTITRLAAVPQIRVTVYSDLACPWCYVGQKRLEKAMDLFHRHLEQQQGQQKQQQKHQQEEKLESSSSSSQEQTRYQPISSVIVVEWKPYVIDPGTNPDGELVEDYCQRRWGGSGWTRDLRRQGQKVGANFANWQWWPNTWKGHQLVQYAHDHAHIDTFTTKAVLFDAMYEQGENLSSVDTLVRIAKKKLGIDENPNSNTNKNAADELRTYLEQDQGLANVRQEIEFGRRTYRISGVPFFVIGRVGNSSKRPYGISGAQDPATLLEIFQELIEDDKEDEE